MQNSFLEMNQWQPGALATWFVGSTRRLRSGLLFLDIEIFAWKFR
jgi:hypothetical protein